MTRMNGVGLTVWAATRRDWNTTEQQVFNRKGVIVEVSYSLGGQPKYIVQWDDTPEADKQPWLPSNLSFTPPAQ